MTLTPFETWLHEGETYPITDLESFEYVGFQEGIFHLPGYHLWNELTTGSTFTTLAKDFSEANESARKTRLRSQN